jgi:ABC-type sugar transport system ATPase subunit
VVIVTHRLGEVWDVATRVAVLADGRWACDEPRLGPLETFLPRHHGLVGA